MNQDSWMCMLSEAMDEAKKVQYAHWWELFKADYIIALTN